MTTVSVLWVQLVRNGAFEAKVRLISIKGRLAPVSFIADIRSHDVAGHLTKLRELDISNINTHILHTYGQVTPSYKSYPGDVAIVY